MIDDKRETDTYWYLQILSCDCDDNIGKIDSVATRAKRRWLRRILTATLVSLEQGREDGWCTWVQLSFLELKWAGSDLLRRAKPSQGV